MGESLMKITVEPALFILILLIALIFIVLGPFIQIWAINTIFKTTIEYSLLNWACVMILNSSVSAVSYKGR
jgi:hypothetical protein